MSRVRTAALVVIAPALIGIVLSLLLDARALPFSGTERISAVFLLDGQAYFGHLDEMPLSGNITLRDVYYFVDARKVTTDLPLALVKRGSELHQPVDVMHIRREKVLAIERVGLDSPIAQAISAQRALQPAASR